MKLGEAYVELKTKGKKKLDSSVKDSRDRVIKATTGMQRGFDSVNLTKASASVSSFTKRIATLQTAIMGFSAGMIARSIGQLGMNFDREMRIVQVVSGATTSEFEKLTAKAREMGATTEFTASQSASALKFLSMAGLEAKESLVALPQMLDLATAGQMDLAAAADIATNVLTQMKMPVEELTRVSDTFVRVQATANTNIYQLAEAFVYTGTQAKTFGMDVEQTASLIGVLANSGIKASMAGTTLRQAMLDLLAPSKQASEIIEKYDIKIKEADGSLRNFVEIIKDMSDAQMEATDVAKLFGARGANIKLIMDEGREGIERYEEEIRSMSMTAKSAADSIRGDARGMIATLKSTIEEVGLAIWDKYRERVIDSTTGLTKYIRSHRQDLVNYLAGVGKGIDVIFGVISKLAKLLDSLPSGVVGAAGAGIIGKLLFGGQVGAVVAGVAYVAQHVGKLGDILGDTAQKKLQQQITDAKSAIAVVERSLESKQRLYLALRGTQPPVDEVKKLNDELERQRGIIKAAQDSLNKLYEENNKVVVYMTDDWGELIFASDDATDEMKNNVNDQYNHMREKAKEHEKFMKDLREKALKEEKERRRDALAEALDDEDKYIQEGLDNIEEIKQKKWEESQKLAEDSRKEVLKKTEEDYKHTYEKIHDIVSDTLNDLWDGQIKSFGDFVKSMKDMFVRAIIEMAAKALTTKIVLPVVMAVTGSGGTASAAGGGIGGGVSSSSITSIINTGGSALKTLGGYLGIGGSSIGAGAMAEGVGAGAPAMYSGFGSGVEAFYGAMPGTAAAIGSGSIQIGSYAPMVTSSMASSSSGGVLGSGIGSSTLGAYGALGALGYSTIGKWVGLPQGEWSGLGAGVGAVGGGIAGGAVLGAQLGSWAGPIGAAIGAIIGGVAASFIGHKGPNEFTLDELESGKTPRYLTMWNQNDPWGASTGTGLGFRTRKVQSSKGHWYNQIVENVDKAFNAIITQTNESTLNYLEEFPERYKEIVLDKMEGESIQMRLPKGRFKTTEAEQVMANVLENFVGDITEKLDSILQESAIEYAKELILEMDTYKGKFKRNLIEELAGASVEDLASVFSGLNVLEQQIANYDSVLQDTIDRDTMSEYAYQLKQLDLWYEGQLDEFEGLEDILTNKELKRLRNKLAAVYELEKENLKDLIQTASMVGEPIFRGEVGGVIYSDVFTAEAVGEPIFQKTPSAMMVGKPIFQETSNAMMVGEPMILPEQQKMIDNWTDWLRNLTFNERLAPVGMSTEKMKNMYGKLYKTALGGESSDVRALQSFVTGEYMPWMKAYMGGGGPDYESFWNRTINQLEAIAEVQTDTTIEINFDGESLAKVIIKQLGSNPELASAICDAVGVNVFKPSTFFH